MTKMSEELTLEKLIEAFEYIRPLVLGKDSKVFINGNNKIAVRYKVSEFSYGVFVIEDDGTINHYE